MEEVSCNVIPVHGEQSCFVFYCSLCNLLGTPRATMEEAQQDCRDHFDTPLQHEGVILHYDPQHLRPVLPPDS